MKYKSFGIAQSGSWRVSWKWAK